MAPPFLDKIHNFRHPPKSLKHVKHSAHLNITNTTYCTFKHKRQNKWIYVILFLKKIYVYQNSYLWHTTVYIREEKIPKYIPS